MLPSKSCRILWLFRGSQLYSFSSRRSNCSKKVSVSAGTAISTFVISTKSLSSSSNNLGQKKHKDKKQVEPTDQDIQANLLNNEQFISLDHTLKPISCKELLETCQVGQEIRIQGWVRGLRRLKTATFFDVNDGSTFTRIPVVIDARKAPSLITLLSSIDVTGELVQNPKNPGVLEIHPTKPIQVLGICNQQEYPMRGKDEAKYDSEHMRQYFHLRFKHSKFASMMRIRSLTSQAIHDFFNTNGYFQVHTPIITSNDCEGAGELFTIKPTNNEMIEEMKKQSGPSRTPESTFFDEQVFLSVSGQLHLEAVTGGLEKVWTFSPIFRAENNQSTRHLTEFYMVEAEIGFLYKIEQLLAIMEDLVKFCIRRIVFDNFGEFNHYCEGNSEPRRLMESILKNPFTIMTFDEARNLLASKANSSAIDAGKVLSREEELRLVELNNNVPVFVINWPENIKPFYMRQCQENSLQVAAVDLLVPKVGELCGGSLREHRLHILESKLDNLDPTGKLKQSLSWYLDLRRFGSVPTGGFGLGFDRLLQLFLGCGNIKDVCPFPRWPHNCPM